MQNTLMTPQEFEQDLTSIVDFLDKSLHNLLEKAKKGQGIEDVSHVAVIGVADPSKYTSPERLLDRICELGAWGRDQVAGVSSTHRGSTTKKVRKALGYTRP